MRNSGTFRLSYNQITTNITQSANYGRTKERYDEKKKKKKIEKT